MGLLLFRAFLAINAFNIATENPVTPNPYRFPVYPVNECPKSENEFKTAAQRRNCTRGSRYLCAPNKYISSLIEFCTDRSRGLYKKGNCVLLEGTGDLDSYSCEEKFNSSCPLEPYFDEDIFKYPACLEIDRELQCFVADNNCSKRELPTIETPLNISTMETVGNETFRRSSPRLLAIVYIIAVVSAGMILILVIFQKRRKEQGERYKKKDENKSLLKDPEPPIEHNDDVQLIMLPDTVKNDPQKSKTIQREEKQNEESGYETATVDGKQHKPEIDDDKLRQFLSKGNISVCHVRCIIVGCGKAGKTTLLKRLQNASFDELMRIERTEMVDFHVNSFEVLLEEETIQSVNKEDTLPTILFSKEKLEMGLKANAGKITEEADQPGVNKEDISKEKLEMGLKANAGKMTEEADQPGVGGKNLLVENSSQKNTENIPRDVPKNPANNNNAENEGKSIPEPQDKIQIQLSQNTYETHVEDDKINFEKDAILKIKDAVNELLNENDLRPRITFLDFAGQSMYYAFHQIFLRPKSCSILVVDMTKSLNDEVDVQDGNEKECCQFALWRYRDYYKFWLKSIDSFSDTDSPVIIVGTHADKLSKEECRTFPESLLNFFDNLSHSNLRRHINADRMYTIGFPDSGSELEDLKDLKKCIAYIMKCPRYSEENIRPVWALFEHLLNKLKETKKVIPKKILSYYCDQLSAQEFRLDQSEISKMLVFFHRVGVLLYFDQDGLKEKIILDIQWLLDAFKCIIEYPVRPEENDIKRRHFCRTGELDNAELDRIWHIQGKDFLKHKTTIIAYMQQLGLLMPLKELNSIDSTVYYFPSMNSKKFDKTGENNSKSSIICFKFDDEMQLPINVFHRIVLKCSNLNNWSILTEGTKNNICLYQNAACFSFQKHVVVLCNCNFEIRVQVWASPKIYDGILLKKIKHSVEDIIRGDDLSYKIGYKCRKDVLNVEEDVSFISQSTFPVSDYLCEICDVDKKHVVDNDICWELEVNENKDEMQGNHVLTTNDEMLQKHFAFLYMKLEPRQVAHLLFQSGYISVDEHDEVIECNRKIGRLKSLLAILKKDNLYTHFVCTLQSLKCNSVLETLQRNEQLESHIGEYELYIQHNFILLQTELPDPDLAKVMMEHELDKSHISDIESCGGKIRQISKLLKILLMKGTPSCKELLRVIEFDLKREELIQRLKDISTDKKKRGKPDLCPERRSLNISWLQENEEVIIQELDPLYVCDLLFEDRAIEIIEHDTITELKLRKEQVRNLLKTVKKNKNDCFHFFLYILQNEYNSIGKKDEKSVQAAITTESNENFECSASHRLRKLPGKPDDVQNELIEVKLKADHGSQGEQVLQNIHYSTGISEESISCGQMYVEKVSKGCVVLQLRPVTDQAVKTLLNARENNRLVEMITGMLQKADIAKIMDGTMPFEITVQVKYAKPENAKSVKEISRTALIKHRMKANKNVLVYELESTALVSVLRDSKAFDKLAIEFVDKVTNNDERVEMLLSLVENGNSDVVEEFLSALKDLNYCHIVELIDPADIHTKAELIREKITSNYENILEEMQFTFAREVLSRCIGDVDGMGKKILPKNGNRRERMSTFLQFILQEDNNVIEFENILKNNGLGDLLKMGETIQREHTPAQDIEVTVVKDHIPSSLEEVLFESVITLSFSNIDKANKQNLGVVSGNTSVGDQLQKNDTEKIQSPIDNQTTHFQGSLSEHKMTTLSSDSQIDGALLEDSQIDWALLEVQKGYLFMLEHIHEELQLLDYLCQLCESPLRDDEKKDMIDGKGFFMKRVILKCLTSKGEIACREFLEKFKCYPNLYFQFRNAVQSVTNADGLLQNLALTNEGLVDYEGLLIQEMDPSRMSDILFCYGLLNSAMYAEMDSRELNRRQKAKILLDKTRERPEKMNVFCHALVKTECWRAVEYIRKGVNNELPPFRSDSVRCVQVNFRKVLKIFKDCISKEVLFRYMRRRGYIDHSNVPTECVLIKAGLRGRKPGCDCILELIRQQDFALLEEMFRLLDYRKAHPRERTVDFGVEVFRNQRQLFLENLESTPISHILLEEEAFSVDDHDAVNSEKSRLKKVEVLLDILEKDGTELTLESFFFALRDDHFMIEKIEEFRQAGAEVHTDRGPLRNIHVREVEEVGFEATETASRGMIVSIPVEGGEERIRQAVEQLNIDSNFKEEIAQQSHMTVKRVDMGSVVLRLVAMTDNASERLLAKSGENVKKLVETFLKFSDLKEDMIKGNIKVTVLVPEEEIGSGDQTMASDKEIKVKEHWNMLVEELVPSILAKKLLEKGVLNDSNVTAINSENTRKGKVECLLNMLPTVKGKDAYGALFESLHELGKSDIVEQIKPSENMHQEAEKVRYGLLSRLNEVIDEIESEFIEETFKQCGFLENPMDKVKSDMSKSRKERALNFLMSIFVNDAYVLAFKNVLDSYKLNPLYELKMPIDESIFSKSPRTTRKRSKGEKLFECEYKVIRKGEEVEDAHMDWESSYSDMERQTDVPKPKYYEPKKILDPKPRPVRQAQVAVPKRIYGRPGDEGSKENEEEWPVVVALDFGTTYSGYAFWRKENPSEITTGKWNTGSKEVLESLKTPTSLLLNQNNEVIEFGYKAEKIFKELAEDEDDKGYRYFRQFKMTLHNESLFDEKRPIPDHLKRPLEALEVFSLSIRDLRDECFRDFDNKRIKVDPDDILWILTVPAIWGDSAKQFMRKAAEEAGIPSDQLKLALEPEAAAIYVMKEAKTVFGKGTVTTFNPGTKIMVADLGGGTADLTVLEVKEDRKMKQLHQSAGGAWGGNLINKKIWEIMEEIFGSDVIEDFKKQTSDFMEMESIIELKKRDITIGSKLELPIFPSLSGLCKQDYRTLIKNSKYGNSVKARTGKLRFEPDMVQKIFDLTFTNLFTVVKRVLKHENAVGVKDIILVGGFAQADIIVKQFEEKFSGYKVIVPTDPVLAVLKGAVMFGQDIDIISSRITAHTYGFDAMRHFRDGDLRSKKRKIDNTIYCVDLFEKMVAIGESVDVGKTFEKEVFASSKEMKSMVLKFYQSEIKNPTYVTDPGCKCIGKLSVEMPDLSGGTERSVIVSIKFGETEITVCGVDKTTGKRQETMLNLLGGETD